jgi:quercetin dioxygenase-like cupin family protein
MKIRLEDHVKFDEARMAKIALATTSCCQLDLYCVAPGQSQRPHTHADQDKIYYVLEGAGRFSLAGRDERLLKGEALVAEAGVEHGLFNDGNEPMLILVVVTPPPPHGPGVQKS